MDEMSEKAAELDAERRQTIEDTLLTQRDQAFEQVISMDARLTQYNFLANAGGAAATLAFMGASQGDAHVGVWPLMCFVVGLIATGGQIRALLEFFGLLHLDAIRRREGFSSNTLTVRECVLPSDIGKRYRYLNRWSSWVSQSAFTAGALLGIGLLLEHFF